MRSVAFILLAGENGATALRAIHEAEKSFAALKWDYEIMAVAANDRARLMLEQAFAGETCQGRPVRLLNTGNENAGKVIGEAIQSTSQDWIAVADAELALDDLPWQ